MSMMGMIELTLWDAKVAEEASSYFISMQQCPGKKRAYETVSEKK